ncbi:glycosyltransferase [Variovorax saccharolyticus]|uniref:glycosyltransferase n=1 Tax=Variovorax saccharolyticus TaxID=3053516 RepID=UPI002578E494|nr:glycosyltransferase [Variovorax sp. J31P216]MDM0028701.1 glycosyltransferase [Variovorax sp. J31P216]
MRSLKSGGDAEVVGRSNLFDPNFYRLAYPDVEGSGLPPLSHFMRIGLPAGRHPSASFAPDFYACLNKDVDGPASSFLHYLRQGRHEVRPTAPAPFSGPHFESILEEVRQSGWFDADFYRTAHPALEQSEMDPLTHYLVVGYRHYIEPSAKISTRSYIGRYPDIRRAGLNPLVHWLRYGKHEGRSIALEQVKFPWFEDDRGYPLPDDVVQHEIMAGQAYFGRMGFSLTDRHSAKGLGRAVELMAQRQPELTIDGLAPKVSIVIPIYGQVHFALGCLDSLARQKSKYSVEIVVADDASPTDSQTELLAGIPWIRYTRRVENGGFLECCNWAVQSTRGEYVVLLNSDTRVVEGWLDELIDGFDHFPQAGMVGSKLFNDDGTLQEAGGIFWRDGSAHNYGRGDDPSRPQYCFARQADFISGASIALRRKVWDELGGFDPFYKPAYCEDADLAFRLRRAGHEVWFLPFSRVVHYEGVTHGRDTTQGIKAYQVENLKKFARRFQAELSLHPQPGSSSLLAASWRSKKHMLVVDALTPTPDQDSGSIVTTEVMRTYREQGFAEHFFAQHDPFWSHQYTTTLQRSGVCCHYQPFSADVEKILSAGTSFDYALLYRYNVASAVYEQLKAGAPSARILFANVDLHYLREMRAATTSDDRNAVFSAMVTKTRELEIFARADASFVHTEVERNIIQEAMPAPLKNIVVLPWLSETSESAGACPERVDIMFLANFPHLPNVDSIKFFMQSIWPTLERTLPANARLLVVGNKPPPEVLAMASDRIIVTGYVEDLSPYFSSSRVFVAPLRYGAGIKGKLVMALAHGVPSVATSVAAEGIGSHDCRHLVVADEPERFAESVLRVYQDEQKWIELREAGLAFVRDNYSRDTASKLCAEALKVADETWSRRQEFIGRAVLERIMADNGEFIADVATPFPQS